MHQMHTANPSNVHHWTKSTSHYRTTLSYGDATRTNDHCAWRVLALQPPNQYYLITSYLYKRRLWRNSSSYILTDDIRILRFASNYLFNQAFVVEQYCGVVVFTMIIVYYYTDSMEVSGLRCRHWTTPGPSSCSNGTTPDKTELVWIEHPKDRKNWFGSGQMHAFVTINDRQ